MWTRHEQTEAAMLASERRRREDEAPRLVEQVPALAELSIDIDEYREDSLVLAARHTRRIVVASAPAHFEILCTDDRCRGGGHDLTPEIMGALSSRSAQFQGEHVCAGQLGTGECRRTLRYVVHARYDGPQVPDTDRGPKLRHRRAE